MITSTFITRMMLKIQNGIIFPQQNALPVNLLGTRNGRSHQTLTRCRQRLEMCRLSVLIYRTGLLRKAQHQLAHITLMEVLKSTMMSMMWHSWWLNPRSSFRYELPSYMYLGLLFEYIVFLKFHRRKIINLDIFTLIMRVPSFN